MNLRIIASLLFLPLWTQAAEEGARIEVRLKEYYDSIGKKAIERAVGFYHPKSAKLDRAQAEFEEFTKQFDLSYKITGFKQVGEVDGDVVVAFNEATTFSKVGGDALNTFNAKVLMVWRKDDKGVYRIWDSIALEFAEAVNKPSKNGQQGGADQPATAPESKSEGGDKPQPESEGRSR
jgi:ketosteroid isomerase-like protein